MTACDCPQCAPPPVLKKSFEKRVLALAKECYYARPTFCDPYTWSDALSDATDIILASDFECSIKEITND